MWIIGQIFSTISDQGMEKNATQCGLGRGMLASAFLPNSEFFVSYFIMRGRAIKKNLAIPFFRLFFAVMGFYHVPIRGRRASKKEAPILVGAPHSTLFDMLPVTVLGGPTVISKTENLNLPAFGKIIKSIQPIFVDKRDRNSRQRTIQSVIDRVTSPYDWPQVLIFPEGTCTNRLCLITFKLGAFHPGLPVQPILFRYPNRTDTVTWTWDGPGMLKILWYTFTRAYTNCEIEFLPVYNPNDDEKKNPELYAQNVRCVMAKALGIPMSKYSCDDCSIAKVACELRLPPSSRLILTKKLRIQLGVTETEIEEKWMENNPNVFQNDSSPLFVSKEEFAQLLEIKEDEKSLHKLFGLYSKKNDEGDLVLDWKQYLLAVYLLNRGKSKEDMIRLAFECFKGSVNKHKFQFIMGLIYSVSNKDSESIFETIVCKGEEKIPYNLYLAYVDTSGIHLDALQENNNLVNPNSRDKKED